MQPNSYALAANVSATTSGVQVKGGRGALSISASAFGTSVFLQMLHVDGNWVNMNSNSFTQNQVVPFDLPMGQYRIFISGGTTTALYANLNMIPYG